MERSDHLFNMEEPKKLPTEALKLIIPLATYRKIMAYVTLCDLEISGFCEVEYVEARNAFVAGEVYLLKQEVTGSATHMDEETVSAFNLERIKAGANQLPRLWWHSHVNMEAFFSSIDEETLKDLQNDSFIVALVANKRKAMKAKCYLYNETTTRVMGIEFETAKQMEIDPLPISIDWEYERIPEALRNEVAEKVTKRSYPTQTQYINPQLYSGKEEKKRKHRQASIVKPLFLPKDKIAAAKRIQEKGLIREWDDVGEEWVYRDPYTGAIWIDYWGTIEKYSITDPDDETDFGGRN